MSKDYYQTLGVQKEANESDIKKAFYKLAQKYHPDKKPDGNEAKFKEINEAYQVLSNKDKRAQYDRYGSAGPNMGSGSGGGFGGFGGGFGGFQGGAQGFDFNGIDLEDILSQFGMGGGFGGFGRQRRGKDVQMHLELTFKESILGVEKEIEIPDLSGGRDDGKNKKVKITVPPGVESGQRMKLSGYGYPLQGAESGDLYLVIAVAPHKTLHREGKHLVSELEIKLTDALLGATYEVEGIEGKLSVKIPAGINAGQLVRVRGKGVPGGGMFGTGDLVLQIKIDMSKKLSRKAKEAVEVLQGEGL